MIKIGIKWTAWINKLYDNMKNMKKEIVVIIVQTQPTHLPRWEKRSQSRRIHALAVGVRDPWIRLPVLARIPVWKDCYLFHGLYRNQGKFRWKREVTLVSNRISMLPTLSTQEMSVRKENNYNLQEDGYKYKKYVRQ